MGSSIHDSNITGVPGAFGNNVSSVTTTDGRDLVKIRTLTDDLSDSTTHIIFDVNKAMTGTLPASLKQITSVIGTTVYGADSGTTAGHFTDIEGGLAFDPTSSSTNSGSPGDSSGNAHTLTEHRGYEHDSGFFSGTVTNHYAFDARFHSFGGTVTNWVGFHGLGPAQYSSGTISGVTLFQTDQHSTAATVSGDWTGFEFIEPDNHTITGTVTGFWSNMDGPNLKALALGTSKEVSVVYDSEGASLTNITHTRTAAAGENKTFFNFSPTLSGDASTFNITGVGLQGGYSGSGNSTGALIGSAMSFASSGTGTIAEMMGGRSSVGQVAINITTGDITDAIAHKIIDLSVLEVGTGVAGTVTNLVGLQVDKQTGGTNNYGIWLNGDDLGADIMLGAGKDVAMHFNGTNLEFQGTGIAHTASTVTHDGYVTIAINGVAYNFMVGS